MQMLWGPFGQGLYNNDPASVVFFGGSTDSMIIGLGGSIENTFGGQGVAPTHSHSATPALMRAIGDEIRRDEGLSVNSEEGFESRPEMQLHAVELAVDGFEGAAQNVEFVAKRLLAGAAGGWHSRRQVVLGSPLYVAQAD
jgi:hypothetical protein